MIVELCIMIVGTLRRLTPHTDLTDLTEYFLSNESRIFIKITNP